MSKTNKEKRDNLRAILEAKRISRLSERAQDTKLEELKKLKKETKGSKRGNISTMVNVITKNQEKAWEAECNRTYAQYNVF